MLKRCRVSTLSRTVEKRKKKRDRRKKKGEKRRKRKKRRMEERGGRVFRASRISCASIWGSSGRRRSQLRSQYRDCLKDEGRGKHGRKKKGRKGKEGRDTHEKGYEDEREREIIMQKG